MEIIPNSEDYFALAKIARLSLFWSSSALFSDFPLSYLLIDLAAFYYPYHVIIFAAVEFVTCFIDSFGVKDKKHL